MSKEELRPPSLPECSPPKRCNDWKKTFCIIGERVRKNRNIHALKSSAVWISIKLLSFKTSSLCIFPTIVPDNWGVKKCFLFEQKDITWCATCVWFSLFCLKALLKSSDLPLNRWRTCNTHTHTYIQTEKKGRVKMSVWKGCVCRSAVCHGKWIPEAWSLCNWSQEWIVELCGQIERHK